MLSNVIPIHRWEVHRFAWGTAVKCQRTGEWVRAYISPQGQEINLEGLPVILHSNGIEFIN